MASPHLISPTEGLVDDSQPGSITGSSANQKMRKRTKTGCLTCRKRRIKCGEERPTCGNCIKSKRQCEGYNQRVIFKTPIENWPNHPGHVSTIQYHTSMLPGTRNQQFQQVHPLTQPLESPVVSVQPRPLANYDFSQIDSSSSADIPIAPQQIRIGRPHSYAQESSYQQPLPSPHHQQPLVSPHHHIQTSTTTASYFPQPSPVHTSPPQYTHDQSLGYHASPLYGPCQGTYPQGSTAYDHNQETISAVSQTMPQHALYQQHSTSQSEDRNSYNSHSSVSPRSDQFPPYTESEPALPQYNRQSHAVPQQIHVSSAEMGRAGPYSHSATVSHANFSHSSYSSVQIPHPNLPPGTKYMPQPVLGPSSADSQAKQPQIELQLSLSGFGGDDHVSPTQVLDEAAIENEDDDYWDVQSDEEMPDAEDDNDDNTLLASKELSIMRRIHFEHTNELTIRRYDAFLYDGLLTHYKPEYAASPLRNRKTARVFAHYIHVTAPSVSIYERNPRNSTMLFEGTTPAYQQSLWTYTLPLKALGNQGLLHAMLALASLQIGRLQGASLTPSYKHYAYAIKRLTRDLGHAKKRLSLTTLATSMLLAYYEVWSAEHVKWSTHLVGAAQLLMELDFRSLTREARRLKAAQVAEDRQFPYQNPGMLIDRKSYNQTLDESDMMPNEGLISTIVGKMVSYEDFDIVLEENGSRHEKKTDLPDKLDLQTFDTFQDLYWWYARHDAFKSIISGNPLILPYRKWSDCPPRAPFGRADALYGSHDHMILLMGRIADFTARDRARKIRQVEADKGWRPRPGMPGFGSTGPPPSHMGPPTPTTPTGPPSHMEGPPPGWTGPPPAGWRGPPPPGFGPPQAGPPTGHGQGPPSRPPPLSAMPEFFGMAPSGPPAPLPNSYINPKYQRSPQTPNIPLPKHADLPAAYAAAIEEWDTITAAHAAIAQILSNEPTFAPLPPDMYPPVPGTPSPNTTPFGPALIHRSYAISIIWTLLNLTKIILLRSHPAMPPAAQMAAGICAPATQPYAQLIGRICAGMQIPLGQDLSPALGAVLTESTISLFFAGVQYQDAGQRDWLVTRLVAIDRRTGWASAGTIAQGCETAWERAAATKRGPPYERRTRRVGESGPFLREERRKEDGEGGEGNSERLFVVKERVWAQNLLGTEEDLREGMERVGI